jgi:hypothetical protein
MKALVRLLRHCEAGLASEYRAILADYDRKRPTRVSASTFFTEYAWALLVSGISRDSALTWADRTRFWDVFTLQACKKHPAPYLLRRVGVAAGNRMGRKLAAVCALGRALCGLTPKQVGQRFFGGATKSVQLGEEQVPALDALPFIGKASARFIIRNMGGDLIKDDRYLIAIMRYFRCTVEDLTRAGAKLGWGAGRVDLVLWCYCKQEIGATKRLAKHFRDAGV